MPKVNFLVPSSGQELHNKFSVRLDVDNANSIELYIRRPSSLSSIYLGQAQNLNSNHWRYLWETDKTPNGEYNLYAKVTNQYGNYKSKLIEIEIQNLTKIDQETKKQTEEIQKATQEIETETEVEKSQHKEDFQEAIQKITSKDDKAEETPQKAEEARQEAEKVEQSIEEEINPEVKELNKTIKEIAETKNDDLSKAEEKEKKEEKQEQLEELNQKKEEIKNRITEETQNILEKKEKSKTKTEQEKQIVKEKIKKEIEQLEKNLTITEQERQKKIKQLKKKDTDNDKIPDLEEVRLGTNLSKADSDDDGYLDYDEIKNGYDPLVPSPGDKISYETPKKAKKATVTKDYQVQSVKIKKTKNKKENLVLRGKALFHSFVTIYIYSSQPTVVMAKTDANGNWSYTLDKPLEDGEHEAYVATTNNKGEITSKSEPLYFIKQGGVISSISSHSVFNKISKTAKAATAEATKKQKEFSVFNYIFLAISIIMFIIGIALTIIGLKTSRKYKMQ